MPHFLLEVLWCDCPIGHNNGCAVGLYQLRDGAGMAALRSEHGGLGRLGRSVDFPFRTDAAHEGSRNEESEKRN